MMHGNSNIKLKKNLTNFLDRKEFLLGGRIYYSGFSLSEM